MHNDGMWKGKVQCCEGIWGVLCAAGVTGGFAGGERGVQQYVDEGDLKLAPAGRGEALGFLEGLGLF